MKNALTYITFIVAIVLATVAIGATAHIATKLLILGYNLIP